jgi:hypothetical protein
MEPSESVASIQPEVLARAVERLGRSLGLSRPELEPTPDGFALKHHGMTQYPRINAHVHPIPLERCGDRVCLRLAENLRHCVKISVE